MKMYTCGTMKYGRDEIKLNVFLTTLMFLVASFLED
jgi:hypothetical protein